ncbi:alpha/beta hydrolase [Actinomadura sp. KC06]|uniref:alpha/beta hydrolase fold domain-containing protein n=1 Tax=Actinomadura sp. KC06 TaxID=2530369 RepID=UPI0010504180|nr:alpha/beta hydrolase [Actinomadura sp. KC06]TDD34971.1 alpha/beta hydrolase [Actinomadura sp. KC06]
MLPVPEGIDPQLARLAALQPDLDYGRPQQARAALERALKIAKTMRAAPGPDDGLVVTDRVIPAREGSPDIPVRIYAARGRPEPGPALLFFHGGGFVTGGLETEEVRCSEIARRTGVLVISVDYRLAPEHPFPCAFEDCYDALWWTAANASALGVDGARIALGGNSAGGALTAAVAMAARDQGGPSPAYQVLLYPVIDHRMTTPSMKRFVDTPGWHQRNNVHMVAPLPRHRHARVGVAVRRAGHGGGPFAAPPCLRHDGGVRPVARRGRGVVEDLQQLLVRPVDPAVPVVQAALAAHTHVTPTRSTRPGAARRFRRSRPPRRGRRPSRWRSGGTRSPRRTYCG